MPSFKVGARTVGDGSPVFIVAELSANHGHSLDVALATVDAAADAGADAIKIQTYTPDTLTLPFDRDPFIVRTNNEWAGKTLHALYADAMTPWEWTAALKTRAEARGLVFFSTPFDPTAVDFLEAQGVGLYKVASFELVDLPLVDYVARTGKPMIMSTGMATFAEIERAVRAARSVGNDRLALLRCVSCYPAKSEDMNLAAIAELKTLGTVVGLSDHTRETEVAIAAVALGAKVVEKHFIRDRALGGPDAFFSLEPKEFKELVRAIRACETAIGSARFGPTPAEAKSVAFRRSLFVTADLKAGEIFTAKHVRSVRPSNGLAPEQLPRVLGSIARADVAAGTPLSEAHVGERVAPSGRVQAVLDAAAKAQAPIARVTTSDATFLAELERAGFYHFHETKDGVACERRLASY
ncbi:MAG: pseudaminic acid synthase [Deltaproteobacteria bacterium]|nr:pseudaminic acid synthase [Deltaproteobacteria bacterium]